jgi:phosphate starvation-inducible PhoH-like protein
MRGSTFDDCIIVADEFQNTTKEQCYMFLSRIGNNSKVIITGDTKQTDLKGQSGLADAVYRLRGVRRIGVTEFTIDDCVRSGICKDILIAYSD